MAMENALFARYVVSLVNLVEHACNVGMIRKMRYGGQNAGWSKIIGTCPKTDIWLQLTLDGQDGLGSCRCCLPGICN